MIVISILAGTHIGDGQLVPGLMVTVVGIILGVAIGIPVFGIGLLVSAQGQQKLEGDFGYRCAYIAIPSPTAQKAAVMSLD